MMQVVDGITVTGGTIICEQEFDKDVRYRRVQGAEFWMSLKAPCGNR